MLQILPIAIVKVKECNTPEFYLKKSDKPYILSIEQIELLKKYITL